MHLFHPSASHPSSRDILNRAEGLSKLDEHCSNRQLVAPAIVYVFSRNTKKSTTIKYAVSGNFDGEIAHVSYCHG